jgi:hypothetical protein
MENDFKKEETQQANFANNKTNTSQDLTGINSSKTTIGVISIVVSLLVNPYPMLLFLCPVTFTIFVLKHKTLLQ